MDEAKASNPVRLCAWGTGAGEVAEDVEVEANALVSCVGEVEAKGEGEVLPEAKEEVVPALVHGDVEGCFPPKRRGPLTLAKGELVEAYAANPP